MRFLRGLSGTFIIAFALTSALPLALVAFFAVQHFNRSLEQEYRDRLAGIAELKADQVNALIEAKQRALETLAGLPPLPEDITALVREHAGGESPASVHAKRHERVREILRLVMASDPSFTDISFADDAGTVHISSQARREGADVRGEAWLIGAKDAAYLGPLERSSNGELGLVIAVPMNRNTPSPDGVIAAGVRLSAVNTILENAAGLDASGRTYLISPAGEMLTLPRNGVGRAGIPDARQLALRCFGAEAEGSSSGATADELMLAAFHRLPAGNACLVAEILKDEAFRPLALFRRFMAATSAFALLVAISFGFGIARAVIREIVRLKQAARAVAGGDLATPIRSDAVREIAELARELDLMRENLARANEREKTISAVKTEFIFIAAHQLRTPLSGVKWALKTLLAGDVGRITKMQRRYIERAYDSNERMIRLVADLLDVSRLEEGKFGYEFAVTDFRAFAGSIAEEYRPRFEEKRIAFEIHLPGTRMPVSFDPDRLALALRNVIENALGYTEHGGRVSLNVTESPDGIAVEIADTGVGIPENQREKLFTKFFRGENVIRMQTEGTGLGLFIARNVITAHGGSIAVASEEGKGTTVTFRIPRKRSPNPSGQAPLPTPRA